MEPLNRGLPSLLILTLDGSSTEFLVEIPGMWNEQVLAYCSDGKKYVGCFVSMSQSLAYRYVHVYCPYVITVLATDH